MTETNSKLEKIIGVCQNIRKGAKGMDLCMMYGLGGAFIGSGEQHLVYIGATTIALSIYHQYRMGRE